VKRSLILGLVVVLASSLLALSVDAKPKKKRPYKRTVTARYENPAIGTADTPGACSGCPSFATVGKDRYVKVVVTDDNTPTASVGFSWDTDGDGINDTGFDVCGKTDKPVKLPGGVSITAFPYIGPSTGCPEGASTSGRIRMVFTAKR
jgi:hypothetical protein